MSYDMGRRQSDADREKDAREHAEQMTRLNLANAEKLRLWRVKKLVDAGFAPALATVMEAWGVDVTKAGKMVAAGCTHTMCAEILRPDLPPSHEGTSVKALPAPA